LRQIGRRRHRCGRLHGGHRDQPVVELAAHPPDCRNRSTITRA
jgi:hypothetical protein